MIVDDFQAQHILVSARENVPKGIQTPTSFPNIFSFLMLRRLAYLGFVGFICDSPCHSSVDLEKLRAGAHLVGWVRGLICIAGVLFLLVK
jgi:hypothetical protein